MILKNIFNIYSFHSYDNTPNEAEKLSAVKTSIIIIKNIRK